MYIIFRQQLCKNKNKINIKKTENAFLKTATSQIVEYFYAKNVIVTTLDILLDIVFLRQFLHLYSYNLCFNIKLKIRKEVFF